MSNDAAKELGRKGGQAKSEAKTAAARANASKPRKKPMPELPTKQLMHLAWLELKTERDRCAVVGERYGGLKINGHDLIDVMWNHLQAME